MSEDNNDNDDDDEENDDGLDSPEDGAASSWLEEIGLESKHFPSLLPQNVKVYPFHIQFAFDMSGELLQTLPLQQVNTVPLGITN